jgi:putative hydrolase of the HAD superfamily
MRSEAASVVALRAVLLDAGGTLIEERPARAEIYAQAARRQGRDLAADEMRARMRAAHAELPRTIGEYFRYSEGWFRAFIARIFGGEGLALAPRAVAEVERELLARFSDPGTFHLLPGAAELVASLRARRVVVGVVSNWSERLPDLLAGLGLGPALDFVVVSAVERCEKPEVEIFRRALLRAGVDAAQAVHAGDEVDRDVRGARAAGILPVLVGRGSLDAGGAARVTDLYELERWIGERLR